MPRYTRVSKRRMTEGTALSPLPHDIISDMVEAPKVTRAEPTPLNPSDEPSLGDLPRDYRLEAARLKINKRIDGVIEHVNHQDNLERDARKDDVERIYERASALATRVTELEKIAANWEMRFQNQKDLNTKLVEAMGALKPRLDLIERQWNEASQRLDQLPLAGKQGEFGGLPEHEQRINDAFDVLAEFSDRLAKLEREPAPIFDSRRRTPYDEERSLGQFVPASSINHPHERPLEAEEKRMRDKSAKRAAVKALMSRLAEIIEDD